MSGVSSIKEFMSMLRDEVLEVMLTPEIPKKKL